MRTYFKYPRTFHIPDSPGATSDDKILDNLDFFTNKEVVVTEKMDGENTTIYNDSFHARSIDSRHHLSQSYVKQFSSTLSYNMTDDERICGENVYAKHSIFYENLSDYFLGFSLWNDEVCADWNTTLIRFKELGIKTVPILYQGIFNINKIISTYKSYTENIQREVEGFVIRTIDSFTLEDFHKSVAKYVRLNHVISDKHWKNDIIIPNKLKK